MSCANRENEIQDQRFEEPSSSKLLDDYQGNFQTASCLEIERDTSEIYKNCQRIAQTLINDVSTQAERNYQTDDSEESLLESAVKLRDAGFGNKRVPQKCFKKKGRTHSCRLTVSLRYGKCSQTKSKKDYTKDGGKKKLLKPSAKVQSSSENGKETPLKGKRCRLGGKAKGKPAQEEFLNKRDSDEESDSLYCYRVSLGYFQQFKGDSGASTSYQCEEDDPPTARSPMIPVDRPGATYSEEMELLQLQTWGRPSLVSDDVLNGKLESLEINDENKP